MMASSSTAVLVDLAMFVKPFAQGTPVEEESPACHVSNC